MPWIRLEATSGLRIMAPSFNLPPRVEGIDKLFDNPICARSFHCFRRCTVSADKSGDKDDNFDSACDFMVEVLVLVERQQVGGILGEVTIAVGGELASRDELDIVLNCAFDVIRRTNNSGTRLIFDALCASSFQSSMTTDEVTEYDGLPTRSGSGWGDRRVAQWRATDAMPPNKPRHKDLRSIRFARRKALLYFVGQDVVPVSLLYCRVSGVTSNMCTSSVSSTIHQGRKELQSLMTAAACACKCLVDVIERTLVAAFDVGENVFQHHLLWGGKFDKLPFVAIFSTSGLLCASSSFFRLTDHRDRLFVAAVAIDQLCRWPTERGASAQIPLIHVHDLLLKCGKEELSLNLVFLAVGNAVTCVFGLHSASGGTQWESETLLRFVKKNLMTVKTAVSLRAVVGDDDDDENHDIGNQGCAGEFAPHMLLCRASIYPTPWFYRLIYDMDRVEEETPKMVLLGKSDTPHSNTSTSPKLQGYCDCCSLLGRNLKRNTANKPFVWHTDSVDLPLDVAWCVASSHIVRTEANICCNGRESGHHSLFSIISSGVEDTEKKGRYSASWFQHCWRNAFCVGFKNTDGDGRNSNCSGTFSVDPTKFLHGLSSIGGGPRASVHYEQKAKGNCLFSHKPRIEARAEGDEPLFNSHAMIFPRSFLLERDGVDSCTMTDGTEDSSCITAFYSVGSHKVKGAACDALLQKMVLMEGDMSDREEDVSTLLLQRHRPTSCSEAFALCHEVVCCVLEDIWRSSNFIDGSG